MQLRPCPVSRRKNRCPVEPHIITVSRLCCRARIQAFFGPNPSEKQSVFGCLIRLLNFMRFRYIVIGHPFQNRSRRKRNEVDGAAVEGGEAGDPVEAGGRDGCGRRRPARGGGRAAAASRGRVPARRGRGRGRGRRGSGRGRRPPRRRGRGSRTGAAPPPRAGSPRTVPTCQRSATNRPPARWLARMSSSERIPSSSGMSRLSVYVAWRTARKSASVAGRTAASRSSAARAGRERDVAVVRSR